MKTENNINAGRKKGEKVLTFDQLLENSSKCVWLAQVIHFLVVTLQFAPVFKANNGKGVMWAEQKEAELSVMEVVLNNTDVKYVRIDGDTPERVRRSRLQQFLTDPTITFLICTTRTLGEAVTLVQAFVNIFWSVNANPEAIRQAESRYSCNMILFYLKRTIRIGQTRAVTSIVLLCDDTEDTQRLNILDRITSTDMSNLNERKC